MKRFGPILAVLAVLAIFKKGAMHHGSHDDRRQRFEERAREWHRSEHESMSS